VSGAHDHSRARRGPDDLGNLIHAQSVRHHLRNAGEQHRREGGSGNDQARDSCDMVFRCSGSKHRMGVLGAMVDQPLGSSWAKFKSITKYREIRASARWRAKVTEKVCAEGSFRIISPDPYRALRQSILSLHLAARLGEWQAQD
jgi:hypothetical protein